MYWLLLTILVLSYRCEAALPNIPDCVHLEQQPLDSANPSSIFGANNELQGHAPPVRTGNLRHSRSIPTHHFASNQIKQHPVPMRLFPYEATMDREGITYDAYTMDRWVDAKRTDLMDEQSAWQSGKPWNRLNSLGTNMKQMVAGPDGNPTGIFSGKSGVQVGIPGAADEPTLTDFGDLYANFMFKSNNGGTMEVPIVRGATLLTHIVKNAKPVIKPYCLSSINDQKVNFDCPIEASAADGGSGFLTGTCHSGNLLITLHNTRPIEDLNKIQWAAKTQNAWGQRSMHSCDSSHCKLSSDRKTVTITVQSASGTMAFAVNYIGHYVLPWAWGDHPETVHCSSSGKRSVESKRSPDDITMTAKCDGSKNLEIRVDVSGNNIQGFNKIQYAAESVNQWKSTPAMHSCTSSTCSRQGSEVVVKTKVSDNTIRLAINVIGYTTLPRANWIQNAYVVHCGGSTVYSSKNHNSHVTTGHHAGATSKPHIVHTLSASKKFFIELNEPGSDLPHQTRKFVLYFSEAVEGSVDQSNNVITFTRSGKSYNGLVQLGYLGAGPRGDKSHANYLDENSGVYSYKPRAAYCVSESRNKGYMSFEWNARDLSGKESSDGKLMTVAMPHHELLLKKHNSHLLKTSVYGFKTVSSNNWLLEYDLQPATMEPQHAGVSKIKQDTTNHKMIVDAISRDASNTNLLAICAHSDSYNVGKAIGMVARLASISRAFNTDHYKTLDDSIKTCLEKWLRVDDTLENKWKFKYDNVWGGLFLRATDGNLGFGTDYGFPYYNDHHFHLGYFLYALAYYVKHHQSWGQSHKSRIYSLARDVGNPSYKDTHFPVFRHKDIYTGFSWASGIAPGERQEESASESINCYHGLAALGDAFNDRHLKHVGQLLLAQEILSVREYWQVRQHNRHNFPPILQQFGVCGQIAENSFYVYTLDWACDPNKFPMRHGCLVGIQVIPITAVSRYWVDKEWASSIKQTCEWAINPSLAPDYKLTNSGDMRQLEVGWKAFCHAALSPLDATHRNRAAEYLKTKRPQDLVSGTGSASSLLFILAST